MEQVVSNAAEWKYIGAGLMALGAMGGAIGVGMIFNAFLHGVARNPSTEGKLFKNAIIGAALAEGLGIIAIGLALLLIFI